MLSIVNSLSISELTVGGENRCFGDKVCKDNAHVRDYGTTK